MVDSDKLRYLLERCRSAQVAITEKTLLREWDLKGSLKVG